MYWFIRGAQSALFYYASCTPCIDKARKRKIRQDNRRDREFREYIQQHHAGEYHMQPEPFATNPHWEADFACPTTARPGRSQKKTKNRASSTTSKQPRTSETSQVSRSVQPSPSLRPQRSAADSVVPPALAWDRQQNQRRDDEVWGFEYTDGTFHTGPARPVSRTSTNATSNLNLPSQDKLASASPLLSPLSASRPQPGPGSRTGQGPYNSPPFFADINEMVPPSVALPDEYQNGNAWFRQPPPDRGVMRNSPATSPALSARSRPSTRSKEPGLRRQISNRVLERQLSKTELLALPGPALSRSSTVERRTQRRRAPTLERNEDDIPDILDDNYVPSSASITTSAADKPSTSRSVKPASSTWANSQQRSPQSIDSSAASGSASSGTIVRQYISSEDTSADADVEEAESDDDSTDYDWSPTRPQATAQRPPANIKVGPVDSPTAAAKRARRAKPVRTATAPGISSPTKLSSKQREDRAPAVRGKSYLITSQDVGPHLHTATTNLKQAKPKVQADLDLYRDALAAGQTSDGEMVDELALHEHGGLDVNAMEADSGDDGDEHEDPRWKWTSLRRWSADI